MSIDGWQQAHGAGKQIRTAPTELTVKYARSLDFHLLKPWPASLDQSSAANASAAAAVQQH